MYSFPIKLDVMSAQMESLISLENITYTSKFVSILTYPDLFSFGVSLTPTWQFSCVLMWHCKENIIVWEEMLAPLLTRGSD